MSPGWGAGRVPCRVARGQEMLRDFESQSLVFNHPQSWEEGGKMPVNQRRGRWPQVHQWLCDPGPVTSRQRLFFSSKQQRAPAPGLL